VKDLQPVLQTINMPGRLLRGWRRNPELLHKSGPKRQQIDSRQE